MSPHVDQYLVTRCTASIIIDHIYLIWYIIGLLFSFLYRNKAMPLIPRIFVPVLIVCALLVGCGKRSEIMVTPTSVHVTVGCEIMGKSANLNYPGFKVTAHYIDENNLYWKTDTDEGHETISYARLAANMHFLNWIEKDGIIVSQIIDCESNTVKSFLSREDAESNRGARSGILMSGVISFNE